jgi:hypothetical protein
VLEEVGSSIESRQGTGQTKHAQKLIDEGESPQYVADLLNVGRSTLYRVLVA